MNERRDYWVIHKHAAWLCVAATFAAGAMAGFFIGVLVLV